MSTLEQKIASALVDRAVTSDMLGKLITETEQAITAADVTSETERKRALDPALSPDPIKARQSMEEAAFAAERLRNLLPRLQAKQHKLSDAEEYRTWALTFEAVKPKHAAAAAKLRDVYQQSAGQLLEALVAAQQVDVEVQAVANAKPWDNPHCNGDGKNLPTVECTARGLTSVAADSSLMTMKIPVFSEPNKLAWPPPQTPIGVAVAASMAVPRGPSADWHRDLAERDAARHAEAQRVANFYAKVAQQKEERDNAAARAARLRNGGLP